MSASAVHPLEPTSALTTGRRQRWRHQIERIPQWRTQIEERQIEKRLFVSTRSKSRWIQKIIIYNIVVYCDVDMQYSVLYNVYCVKSSVVYLVGFCPYGMQKKIDNVYCIR